MPVGENWMRCWMRMLERFDESTCKKIVSDWIFIGFCYIGCNPEAQSFVYFNEK